MARTDTLGNFLTDIADSIRTKTGETGTILASEFDTKIESIEGGGTSEDLTEELTTYDTELTTQETTIDDILSALQDKTAGAGDSALPEVGFVPTTWDSNGYIVEGDFYGTSIPNWFFGSYSTDTGNLFKNIVNITFKNDIESLGTNVFYNAQLLNLTSMPEGTYTSIDQYAFFSCKSLNLESLPEQITTIANSAFTSCSSLALTSLPATLTSIGGQAFSGCTNLALTSLPDGLTSIPDYCFQNCTNLALTSLPDGLTSIGKYAFKLCTNLALTSLPDGLTTLSQECFNGCSNLVLTSLPNDMTDIASTAFSGCTNLALTSLPSNLTTINSYVFQNCTNLALTSLPDNLTTINTQGFSGCTSLAFKTLNNVATIGDYGFYGCTSLTQLSMPAITSINGNTATKASFRQCSNLKAIWLGSALTYLPRYCFNYCPLVKIYIDLPRTTVETLSGYTYAFMNNASNTGIIVCNDDEGFITQTEFDAIDWSTYTEE